MSIRRQAVGGVGGGNENGKKTSLYESLIAYPVDAPLVHVERRGVEPVGMPKRSNDEKSDPLPDWFEQMRQAGRRQRMASEDVPRQRGNAIRQEAARIRTKYLTNGKNSITLEERQWYRDNMSGMPVDRSVSELILKKHKTYVDGIMTRLPPSNNTILLEYWQMAGIAETILETVARMCDAIVEEFTKRGLDPIKDAVGRRVGVNTELEFSLVDALPAEIRARGLHPLFVQSFTAALNVKTTSSKANELLTRSWVRDPTSAITWSVLLRGTDQALVTTRNGLNNALNELWMNRLVSSYENYVHAWKLPSPAAISGVTFEDAPVARPSRPSVTPPPNPAPSPRPGVTPPPNPVVTPAFRPKKRDM